MMILRIFGHETARHFDIDIDIFGINGKMSNNGLNRKHIDFGRKQRLGFFFKALFVRGDKRAILCVPVIVRACYSDGRLILNGGETIVPKRFFSLEMFNCPEKGKFSTEIVGNRQCQNIRLTVGELTIFHPSCQLRNWEFEQVNSMMNLRSGRDRLCGATSVSRRFVLQTFHVSGEPAHRLPQVSEASV